MSLPEAYEKQADIRSFECTRKMNGMESYDCFLNQSEDQAKLDVTEVTQDFRGTQRESAEMGIREVFHGRDLSGNDKKVPMIEMWVQKHTGGGKTQKIGIIVPVQAMKALIADYEEEQTTRFEEAKKRFAPKSVEEMLKSAMHTVQVEVSDSCFDVSVYGHSFEEIVKNATSETPKVWKIDDVEIKNRDIPYLIETGELHECNLEIRNGELVIKSSNLCNICGRFIKDKDVEEALNAGVNPPICIHCSSYMQGAPESDVDSKSVEAVKRYRANFCEKCQHGGGPMNVFEGCACQCHKE